MVETAYEGRQGRLKADYLVGDRFCFDFGFSCVSSWACGAQPLPLLVFLLAFSDVCPLLCLGSDGSRHLGNTNLDVLSLARAHLFHQPTGSLPALPLLACLLAPSAP